METDSMVEVKRSIFSSIGGYSLIYLFQFNNCFKDIVAVLSCIVILYTKGGRFWLQF